MDSNGFPHDGNEMSYNPLPSAATKLRHLLTKTTDTLVCPGVYDGLSARLALKHSFPALYLTGAGSTASLLGQPDLALLTQTDMVRHATALASIDASVPLIADADTGYGAPIMVARTLEAYARGGVAGLHIEDQVQSKRCGHLGGKQLVDRATFLARICAAVQARRRIGSDVVVIARTDAAQSLGYEEAVGRLRAAHDVGADVAFLEGIDSQEMGRRVCADLKPMPCLLNMVYGGLTPKMSVEEARELGFRIVIFPLVGVAEAMLALDDGMRYLREEGEMRGVARKVSPMDLFRLCGIDECMKIDAEAGGFAYKDGVEGKVREEVEEAEKGQIGRI